MLQGISLGNLTIDCKSPLPLRDFYAALLGWNPGLIQGFPVLRSPDGLLLLFSEAADFAYIPPVWPEEPGRQQKQMHFDFHVDHVPLAVAEAERLGARQAAAQYGEGRYVTMLDPEGHPFCLCARA